MGAFAQAPRHSTSTTVNFSLASVSPACTPRRSSIAPSTESEPQPPSLHGVVVQTWIKCLPTGVLH